MGKHLNFITLNVIFFGGGVYLSPSDCHIDEMILCFFFFSLFCSVLRLVFQDDYAVEMHVTQTKGKGVHATLVKVYLQRIILNCVFPCNPV